MNDTTQNMLNNANTNIGSQFSQANSFWANIDERTAKEKGRKLGKAIEEGLREGLLKDFTDSIKELGTISQRAIEDAVSKGLKSSAMKEYQKEIDKTREKAEKVATALTEELNKAQPDLQKILTLEKQRLDVVEDMTRLESTSANRVKIAEQEYNLKKAAGDIDKANQQNDEKARKKALADYEAISKLLTFYKDDMSKVTENLKGNSQDIAELLDKILGTMDKGNKTLAESMSNFKNNLSSISGYINDVANLYTSILSAQNLDTRIQAWSSTVDPYTKQSISMSSAFGTGLSNTESFNTFKNDVINSITSVGNIYDYNQIMGMMNDLTNFAFQNNETAIVMSKDLAFAKEYMGQSTESLQSMYALQVRSNQDDFVKKSLNTIAALQRVGNSLSQEQLNQLSSSSMELTDKLMSMGLSGEMADEVYSQLLASADAISKATGNSADGQKLLDLVNSSLDLDTLGSLVSDPSAYMNAFNSGNITGKGGVIDQLLNGPSASGINGNISNGLSLDGILMGNENVFGSTNDNFLRKIFGDKDTLALYSDALNENLTAIENGNSLTELQVDVEQAISDKIQIANEKMTELLEQPWSDIANSIADENFAKTAVDRMQVYMTLATTAIGIAVTTMTALTAAVNANTIANGGSSLKSMAGKIFGSGSTSGTMLNKLSLMGSGTKIGGALNGTKVGSFLTGGGAGSTLGGIVSGVGIAGGVIATGKSIYDGVKVGTQGFTDENGNRVAGTGGFKDGLAAAATNGNLDATVGEDAGSGALKGAGIGAMIGTFVGGPVGTAIGGAIGAGVGALGGLLTNRYKEERKAELEEKKRQEEALALAQITAENTTAIKNQRDAVLSSRYDDDRWGIGSPMTEAAPPAYTAPKDNEDIAGTWSNGTKAIDIDGWSMTSAYGYRMLDGKKNFHNGIDFAHGTYGQPIGAAVAGVVKKVVNGFTWRDSNPDKGIYKANYVDVYSPSNDLTYRYYHLDSAAVQEGQSVQAGNLIGYMGNTGHVSPRPTEKSPHKGAHLHLGVYSGGTPIDPTAYVTSSIFHSNGTASNLQTADNSTVMNASKSNVEATPYLTNYIPNFQTDAAHGDVTSPAPTIVDSPTMVQKLDQINDTLIMIDKRQTDQQKILDALSQTPIKELGV